MTAVMLYAIKSKKVDQKFAQFSKIACLEPGLPAECIAFIHLRCIALRQPGTATAALVFRFMELNTPIQRSFPIFTFCISGCVNGTFGWTADRFLDDLGEIEPVPKWQALASL